MRQMNSYPLSRRRYQVCTDIALNELTNAEIGAKYGVTGGAVAKFKKRESNIAIVADIRRDLVKEYAGVALVDKRERFLIYEHMALKHCDTADPAWGRIVVQILKQLSEELAETPSRAQIMVGRKQLEVLLAGVDPDDLS